MIFKCVYCGSRVKFDIEKQLMRCESCGRLAEQPEMTDTEYMFDQYRCSSCGSLLNVNEEEATSECPYCGEMSVVYEGKNETFRPDRIMPFKVTFNNAVSIIKEEFSKYRFAPKEIRNFNIACVRPIYVPFWVYSVNIETDQILRGEKRVEKKTIVYRYIRAIELDYDNIGVDASKRFADRISIRLEPWYMKDEKDFNPMYISGLYAGFADVDQKTTKQTAIHRAQEFIDKKVMNSCTDTKNNTVVTANYKNKINEQHLSLLPVWFFTAQHKGKKYSAIVNGQTGKVISAVPFFKTAFWGLTAVVAAICYWPAYFIYCFLFSMMQDEGAKAVCLLIGFVILIAGVFAKGCQKYMEYRKTMNVFYSSDMVQYVENRGRKL